MEGGRGPTNAVFWCYVGSWGPSGPRWPPELSRAPKDLPKTSRDPPKTPQRAPKETSKHTKNNDLGYVFVPNFAYTNHLLEASKQAHKSTTNPTSHKPQATCQARWRGWPVGQLDKLGKPLRLEKNKATAKELPLKVCGKTVVD